MSYATISITGQRPTKKEPNKKKITAREALEDFLKMTSNDIVSVLPNGFSGYLVIVRSQR